MAIQNYPKRWGFKPPVGTQINRGHALAQGLIGCWLLNEGAGTIVTDLVRNSQATITTPSAPWMLDQQLGSYIYSNSNNIPAEPFPNTGFPLSVVILIACKDIAGSQVVYFSHDDGSDSCGYRIRMEPGGNINLILAGGAGGQLFDQIAMTTTGNSSTPKYGIWHFFGLTMAAASGTAVGYLAPIGQPLKSQTLTLSGGIAGTPNQVCLNGFTAVPGYSGGSLAQALFYNRVLNPSEMTRLNQDPYCFMSGMSPRIRQYQPSVATPFTWQQLTPMTQPFNPPRVGVLV